MILTTLAQKAICLWDWPIRWFHTQIPQLAIAIACVESLTLQGLIFACRSLLSTQAVNRSASCWVPRSMRFQHRSASSHASDHLTLTMSFSDQLQLFSNLFRFMSKSKLAFRISFKITLFFCCLTECLIIGICCEIPFARNEHGSLGSDSAAIVVYQLSDFKI